MHQKFAFVLTKTKN